MPTIPPAPLDPAQLELSLAPFGSSRMLPRDSYRRADVLAWEREHLFAGWMCLGRSVEIKPGGMRAESVGEYGVLLTRDKEGVLRAFENACRHRGHELLPCGGSADAEGDRLPVPRLVLPHDGSLIGAPHFKEVDVVRQVDARAQAGAGAGVARLGLRRPLRHGLRLRRPHRRARADRGAVRRRLAGDLRDPRVRRRGQLEGHRRELPGVLPLLDDPPRAVPGLPADERGEHRARRATGSAAGWSCGEGAETMSLDGRSGGVAMARLDEHELSHGDVRRRAAQPADLAAPRLRDDPPAGAAHAGLDPDHLLVGVPGRRRRARRLRPGVRRRLLGPHQPPGLDGLRVGPARHVRSPLRGRPAGPRRGRRLPLRHPPRPRLPGHR